MNCPDPLVLYLADSIDARAGAELIRERWPGAELVVGPIAESDSRLDEDRHVWALGFGEGSGGLPDPYGCTAIAATPAASIAMQVWGRLHKPPLACERCPADGKRECDYGTTHCRSVPHTWLRYLDDAVCGRDAATRAWLDSFAPDAAVEALRNMNGHDHPNWGDWGMVQQAGDAILRALDRREDDYFRGVSDGAERANAEGEAVTTINLRIPGPPKGKGATRAGKGFTYTPTDTEAEMVRIALAVGEAYDGPTLGPPARLHITAVLARPKAQQRKKDSPIRFPAPVKPDGSNIQKLVEDALQRCRRCGGQKPTTRSRKRGKCNCGCFSPTIGDDSWITDWSGAKRRAAMLPSCGEYEQPHVYLEISGSTE